MKTLTRSADVEVRIADEKAGICDYVASDESLDSEREVIRVTGWDFSRMERNAPFVNSHNYRSLENQVGKVLCAQMDGRSLIETVQWAVDVPENKLANLGWAMTKAGYLKAVSVGFFPVRLMTRLPADQWPADWAGCQIIDATRRAGRAAWDATAQEMGRDLSPARTVYLEQVQTELSACIIGANPQAVAKSLKEFAHAHKAGVLSDADLDTLSTEYAKATTAPVTDDPADVTRARQRARTAFLLELHQRAKQL